MRTRRPTPFFLALVLSACSVRAEPPPLHAEPARPAPRGDLQDRVERRAPIVRVALRVADSSPAQYFADVTSALPDGCAKFARFAVRREGSTVFVDVFNTAPSNREQIACTMIYGERDSAVPLGSDFTPGATYTLEVNGATQTFVAR